MFKHTKPFNLEHAKAGAPVGTESGHKVRIICTDYNSPSNNNIIGLHTSEATTNEVMAYRKNDGTGYRGSSSFVMIPLFYVDDKPVFVGDKLQATTKEMPCDYFQFTVASNDKFDSQYLYRWPKKKVTKERWQAFLKASLGGEVYSVASHSSKQECEDDCRRYPAFIEARLVSTYEIEE